MSKARKPKTNRALGPGLHALHIDLFADGECRVRTLTGERMRAVVGDAVDPALVEECLRFGRMVIGADTERGPTVIGALQTTRSLSHEPDGTVVLEAKEIRLRARERVRVEAGASSLSLQKAGRSNLRGERLVIDMSSNVRVLSALVELP
jgi:hypothetical protein